MNKNNINTKDIQLQQPSKSSVFLIVVGIGLFLLLVGGGAVAYYLYKTGFFNSSVCPNVTDGRNKKKIDLHFLDESDSNYIYIGGTNTKGYMGDGWQTMPSNLVPTGTLVPVSTDKQYLSNLQNNLQKSISLLHNYCPPNNCITKNSDMSINSFKTGNSDKIYQVTNGCFKNNSDN
jgi:hypothetical protein